ncbi:MAG: hypothetical protein V4568_19030 [Pseudomonadota bacterium]
MHPDNGDNAPDTSTTSIEEGAFDEEALDRQLEAALFKRVDGLAAWRKHLLSAVKRANHEDELQNLQVMSLDKALENISLDHSFKEEPSLRNQLTRQFEVGQVTEERRELYAKRESLEKELRELTDKQYPDLEKAFKDMGLDHSPLIEKWKQAEMSAEKQVQLELSQREPQQQLRKLLTQRLQADLMSQELLAQRQEASNKDSSQLLATPLGATAIDLNNRLNTLSTTREELSKQIEELMPTLQPEVLIQARRQAQRDHQLIQQVEKTAVVLENLRHTDTNLKAVAYSITVVQDGERVGKVGIPVQPISMAGDKLIVYSQLDKDSREHIYVVSTAQAKDASQDLDELAVAFNEGKPGLLRRSFHIPSASDRARLQRAREKESPVLDAKQTNKRKR